LLSWALLGRGLNGTRPVPPLSHFIVRMVARRFGMSAFGGKADISLTLPNVCF